MESYDEQSKLSDVEKNTILSMFKGILKSIKNISYNKVLKYISFTYMVCKLHHDSINNRNVKNKDKSKFHPVKPSRGEIFDAIFIEGIGSELSNNHPVVIIQNKK